MTAAERPWWATDEGATPDADEDPLEAHRAARRGVHPAEDGAPAAPTAGAGDARAGAGEASANGREHADDGSWWVPATEAMSRLARELGASVSASAGAGDAGPTRGRGQDPTGTAGDPAGGDPAGGDPVGGDPAGGDPAGGGGGGDGGHRIDACGVCPICVGLRAIGDARPDLVGHLAEAARQLALAVRTVVDAAAPDGEAASERGAGQRPTSRRTADDLHRIDLDD